MACDIIVITVAMVTYISYIRVILQGNRRFQETCEDDGRRNNLRKMFLIPFLIVAGFLVFNVIPDLIIFYHFNDVIHNVASVLWALGFNVDPLIYIFLNMTSRDIALNVLKNICGRCCRYRRQTVVNDNNIERNAIPKVICTDALEVVEM